MKGKDENVCSGKACCCATKIFAPDDPSSRMSDALLGVY